MRGNAFIAFFGIATAISGALVGCGDDDAEETTPAPASTRKGAEGDSCTRTDDCDKELACISNVCLPDGSSGTGGTGGSSGTGGTTGKGGATGSLGSDGESCTRRADCAPMLGCYNNRCAAMPSGEGGAGPTPTVGGPGETCQLSSDCEQGLVCIPGGQTNAGPGVGNTGVCTATDSGVSSTGMTCNGAECRVPADCCELPVELHAAVDVKSCTELADIVAAIDCDAANLAALEAAQCFANAVYCTCTTTALNRNWECSEAGRCVYTAACTTDGLAPGGCATVSRAGNPLVGTCNVADTETCVLPGTMPFCTDEASCDGVFVSDDIGDRCDSGECTCFLESQCLRKCAEDLDCRAGFACDTGDHVCKPQNACSSDLYCQGLHGDIRWTCSSAGVCTFPCETDLDCNPGGFTNGRFSMVCESNQCVALGCQDDSECPGAPSGVHLFCTEPVPGSAADQGHSAITD